MMTYTAPDNHVMESSTFTVVSYTCQIGGIPGIYTSFETKASSSPIGIEQIKIVRTITETETTIEISESTDQELENYIQLANAG